MASCPRSPPAAVFLAAADLAVIRAERRRAARLLGDSDAPINLRNSGCSLLDAEGHVIDVVSQGRGNGIAFAVPVDTVKRLLARVAAG